MWTWDPVSNVFEFHEPLLPLPGQTLSATYWSSCDGSWQGRGNTRRALELLSQPTRSGSSSTQHPRSQPSTFPTFLTGRGAAQHLLGPGLMEEQVRAPQLSIRRRGHLLAAAMVVAFAPVDWVELGHFSPVTLGLRLAWGAAVALLGLHLPHAGARAQKLSGTLTGVVSATLLGLLVFVTGGVSSSLLHLMLVLPLMVVVLMHMDVRAVVWTSAVCLVWTVALGLLQEQHLRATLQWTVLQFGSSGLAVTGAVFLRAIVRAREEETRERMRTAARLEASEQLRAQVEQLALVGRLAAGVAHEVNNPLAYVRTNLGFLEDSFKQPGEFTEQEVQELFTESREGLERIRQIVTDLKIFARADPLSMRPCELRPLMEEAVRMGRVRLNSLARVELVVEPSLPQVRVHDRHFVQVILNLLVNAADALEEAKTQDASVWVRASLREGGVEVVVEDNGPGIPESVLPRLFEPFFTTNAAGSGTGLGLPLSREYVEQMGGTLLPGPRSGGGGRFVITLPVHALDASEDELPLLRPLLS